MADIAVPIFFFVKEECEDSRFAWDIGSLPGGNTPALSERQTGEGQLKIRKGSEESTQREETRDCFSDSSVWIAVNLHLSICVSSVAYSPDFGFAQLMDLN